MDVNRLCGLIEVTSNHHIFACIFYFLRFPTLAFVSIVNCAMLLTNASRSKTIN